MNHLKNAWKSVTIWFNGVMGGLWYIVTNFKDEIAAQLPMLQQYLTADVVKYAVGALVMINIALRFKTNKSLADK